MNSISCRLVEGAQFAFSITLEIEYFTDVKVVVKLSWKYRSQLSSMHPFIKVEHEFIPVL
jgi:hypothetical protein